MAVPEEGNTPSFEEKDDFDRETISYTGVSPAQTELYLKRLGGGVAEKHRRVEGVGFQAAIVENNGGVDVIFYAHEELLDDLIRRFEDMIDKET